MHPDSYRNGGHFSFIADYYEDPEGTESFIILIELKKGTLPITETTSQRNYEQEKTTPVIIRVVINRKMNV